MGNKKIIDQLKKDLQNSVKPGKQAALSRFFKTGPGEYGESDIFMGVMVPDIRRVVSQYKNLPLVDVQQLLNDKIHEVRLTGVLILVKQFQQADKEDLSTELRTKRKLFDFYIKNISRINNWDLVDLSAPHIVGGYLLDKDRQLLYKLVKSNSLWSRRIAVLATAMFIRNSDFKDTIKLTAILLNDKHDLIHKAVGWMLREVGKKNQKVLEKFLNRHIQSMPRTMLRYAIEKFPDKKRKYYLNI